MKPDLSDPLLMLDRASGQIFPLSPRAFEVITQSRAKTKARCSAVLVLDSRGDVWRIADVHPESSGLLPTLRLLVGLSVGAEFEFERVEMGKADFAREFLQLAGKNADFQDADEDWWVLTAPIEELEAAVSAAPDLAGFHAMLRFPADCNCLDLL